MKSKQSWGIFSIVLLLLAIIPLVSASGDVWVQSTWLENGSPLEGQETLTVTSGDEVQFVVYISALSNVDSFSFELVDYNNEPIVAPGFDIAWAEYSGTDEYIVTYTPEDAGTFTILATAATMNGEDYDTLSLVVHCVDVDDNGICDQVEGCTNSEAENYDSTATEDDGSCILPPEECVPDTIENGIIGNYPGCEISCNENYEFDADTNSCVEVPVEELNVTPIISLGNLEDSYFENQEISYTFSVSDEDNGDLTVTANTGEEVATSIIDFLICALTFGQVCEFDEALSLEDLDATFNDNEDGTYTFVWTPSYDFVEHPNTEKPMAIFFHVTGGVNNVFEEVVFNIEDVNRAPTGEIIAPEQVYVGEVFTVTAEAEDADGDTLEYNWANIVGGEGSQVSLSYNTAGIVWLGLTIKDGFGGQDVLTKEIVIVEPEVCDFATIENGVVSEYPDCEITCNDGYVYDVTTGECVVEEIVCDDGYVYDVTTGECVVEEIVCDDGYVYDETTGECVVEEIEVCDPATVDNGVVSEYPTCEVTCDAGYNFDEETNTCNQIICDDGFHLEEDTCVVDDVYGCTDSSALNYNSLAVVDNDECEYPVLNEGLYFQSVHFVEEVVSVGGYLQASINIANNEDLELEDLQVSMLIPELGLKVSSSEFDLEDGEQKGTGLYLPLYYAPQGTYLVKVTVSNDYYHRSIYRQVVVQ